MPKAKVTYELTVEVEVDVTRETYNDFEHWDKVEAGDQAALDDLKDWVEVTEDGQSFETLTDLLINEDQNVVVEVSVQLVEE